MKEQKEAEGICFISGADEKEAIARGILEALPKELSDGDGLCLCPVTEVNFRAAAGLRVKEEQKRFVPSPEGILARAWCYQDEGAAAYAVTAENKTVGLLLVYEMEEEPACYFLMELLIDVDSQNRGYASRAVKLLLARLSAAPKFPRVELSVDRENAAAIHVYQKLGFVDSGYTDPDLPQYLNMVYTLT